MTNRNIKAIALNGFLAAAILLTGSSAGLAQSTPLDMTEANKNRVA